MWFDPTFATGRAAINHLLRVSVSVCVPPEPTPREAPAEFFNHVEHAEAGG